MGMWTLLWIGPLFDWIDCSILLRIGRRIFVICVEHKGHLWVELSHSETATFMACFYRAGLRLASQDYFSRSAIDTVFLCSML